MIDESRRKLLSMLGMAPIAGGVLSMGAAGATASDTRPGTRAATSDNTVSAMARRRIQEQHLPNIPLLTQEGKQVRFYDDLIKDKIVTLNFFFAKCDEICPKVMANLVKVQKLLGDQVGRELFMYSFTLKPEEDTPDVLKRYAETYRMKPGWTLLTGKPKDIDRKSVV